MNFNDFVGVDVSKKTLDYHIENQNKFGQVPNTKDGIKKFLDTIFSLCGPNVAVLSEATGGYEQLLAQLCAEQKVKIFVVQPQQVRCFAKALNKLAKTDKIDSLVLSKFCSMMHNELNEYKYNPAHGQLRDLIRRRSELVEHKTALTNRMKMHMPEDYVYASYFAELTNLKNLIKDIDKALKAFVDKDSYLKNQFKLLCTICGVGKIVAYQIIAEIPEMLELSKNQLTSLIGLAPINKDSGASRGKRMIQGGRKQVRTALYMAAVTSIKYDNDLRKFYDRLIQNGKSFKVAITAICRKLLIMAQSVLKRNSPWVSDFSA